MRLLKHIAAIFCLSVLAQAVATADTNAPASPPKLPAPPARTVGEINFQGTPVQAVLDYYAQNLAKRSIISAPNLAGVIWFRSQTDLTVDEAKRALDTVLAMNGIAVLPFGDKFLKVVQINTAKQEAPPFIGEGREQPASDALMTQVLSVKYAEPADVVAALQPFLHSYGQLIPLPKSSCVLISETAANVNQMLEIIKAVDVPSALKMETKVIILKHAKAAEVVARLQAIIQETQQAGGRPSATGGTPAPAPNIPAPPGVRVPARPASASATVAGGGNDDSVVEGKVVLTSDERTNKIFILSRNSNFPFFDKLIAELDAKVEPDVLIRVFNLDYAPCEDVASLINSLITGGTPTFTTRRSSSSSSSGSGSTRTSTPPPPPVAVPSSVSGGGAVDTGLLEFAQGVRILPDPRTNSMLVMATKEDMARIESLIKSIDTPVAQVLIEVVIAEINLDSNLDIEVSAFKRPFQQGQLKQGGGYINKTPTPQDVISSVLGSNTIQAASLPSGGLAWFMSFKNWKLDAVVRAMSSSSRFKVLSTPIIQTMHNQEADIVVGESRPVPVSTVSSVVGSSGTLATGQLNSNIEYKDIAIELKVTPRVNPGGFVTMDIEQKVNDVGGQVSFNGTDVPIITKREAKSSIIVKDQSTIVLGGLIKEGKTITESKVPFLGDIPFFGALFKGKSTTKTRTELILFIRPSVLRNQAEAVAEALRRTNKLRAGKELNLNEQFLSGPTPEPEASAPTNSVSTVIVIPETTSTNVAPPESTDYAPPAPQPEAEPAAPPTESMSVPAQ
jgi:general secretion pathway protein D